MFSYAAAAENAVCSYLVKKNTQFTVYGPTYFCDWDAGKEKAAKCCFLLTVHTNCTVHWNTVHWTVQLAWTVYIDTLLT